MIHGQRILIQNTPAGCGRHRTGRVTLHVAVFRTGVVFFVVLDGGNEASLGELEIAEAIDFVAGRRAWLGDVLLDVDAVEEGGVLGLGLAFGDGNVGRHEP